MAGKVMLYRCIDGAVHSMVINEGEDYEEGWCDSPDAAWDAVAGSKDAEPPKRKRGRPPKVNDD